MLDIERYGDIASFSDGKRWGRFSPAMASLQPLAAARLAFYHHYQPKLNYTRKQVLACAHDFSLIDADSAFLALQERANGTNARHAVLFSFILLTFRLLSAHRFSLQRRCLSVNTFRRYFARPYSTADGLARR